MLVYLNANVYNDVERGSIPATEVAGFRTERLRPGGTLDVRLGLPDLEECLGLWDTDRPTALRRLRIVRDLAGFEGLLKEPGEILEDAIRAYADGRAIPFALMARHDRRHFAAVLGKIAEGSTKYDREVAEMMAEVKASKDRYKAAMTDARDRSLNELSHRFTQRELGALPFVDFFARGATDYAAAFTDRKGLADACRDRGLAGLLGVRTVRLCIGVVMSQIHSEVSAGRKPEIGDGYDIWHAILASTADVFITSDQRLFGHLDRIPDVDGFRVVKSLREALAIAGA